MPQRPQHTHSNRADGINHIGYRSDTIVALATPVGRGGVAVVRISGAKALTIIQQLCTTALDDKPRHAFLVELRTPADHQLLDKSLVTYFEAPASFTGEDVVEISTHGGHVTPQRIIREIIKLGARPAEPGEFSLRAFLNGKMNLAEAEALNHLVSSLSSRAQVAATDNLDGRLSQEIEHVRESLVLLLTIMEHELDFSEEEIDVTSSQEIKQTITAAIEGLQHLRETAPYGRMIRDGVRVILAGSPNAGKSSLFNALIGHERAIVTDIPGTTRDSLEAWIDLDGFPVCLVDTAGLRDDAEGIEKIGVERSQQELSAADITLMLDPEDPFSSEQLSNHEKRTVLYVQSKADLPSLKIKKEAIQVSIMHEDGLDELLKHLKATLNSYLPSRESAVVISNRQLSALQASLQHLVEAQEQLDSGQPTDIVSGEVRLSVNCLSEIIGDITSEEIVHQIFSEFCIGK